MVNGEALSLEAVSLNGDPEFEIVAGVQAERVQRNEKFCNVTKYVAHLGLFYLWSAGLQGKGCGASRTFEVDLKPRVSREV